MSHYFKASLNLTLNVRVYTLLTIFTSHLFISSFPLGRKFIITEFNHLYCIMNVTIYLCMCHAIKNNTFGEVKLYTLKLLPTSLVVCYNKCLSIHLMIGNKWHQNYHFNVRTRIMKGHFYTGWPKKTIPKICLIYIIN